MGGRRHNRAFEPSNQRIKEPPEQFAHIGPGRGQHGVDRIALQAGQEAPAHAVIAFQVSDLRLNRTAASPAAPV